MTTTRITAKKQKYKKKNVLRQSDTRFLASAFFPRISYPLAPEYSIGAISNVYEKCGDIHSFVFIAGAVRKIYCTALSHSPPKPSYGPWKLMYVKVPPDL